ncbi:unnamed protein product [Strongylus vulgaris]|uniref:Uncharacterized protein n=1 Tax=Strongylus vulgaris TaxID=40348 RepID=A0A3P7J5M6_STRVU|nr:unnamed protein product [Strongylus vulgaris]
MSYQRKLVLVIIHTVQEQDYAWLAFQVFIVGRKRQDCYDGNGKEPVLSPNTGHADIVRRRHSPRLPVAATFCS